MALRSKMKAIRLQKPGSPLVEQNVAEPKPGPKDVTVAVQAAGICHSDVHYRSGTSRTNWPVTPGHEIAGTIVQVGNQVQTHRAGDRVCLHYLVTCGSCAACKSGSEQFCEHGEMLGKHRDGGYAETICVPARNAIRVPDHVSLDVAAIMMCSSATSLHALRKGRLAEDETVAVFGCGGLGLSAIQLAKILNAKTVFAVDIKDSKLELAASWGAVPVHAGLLDPVEEIRRMTLGRGVDVALELIGTARTMEQAARALAPKGRVVIAGISGEDLVIDTYNLLINNEIEIIGCSDHLIGEVKDLLQWAAGGFVNLSEAIVQYLPLEADRINSVLDQMEQYAVGGRVVIVPANS